MENNSLKENLEIASEMLLVKDCSLTWLTVKLVT